MQFNATFLLKVKTDECIPGEVLREISRLHTHLAAARTLLALL